MATHIASHTYTSEEAADHIHGNPGDIAIGVIIGRTSEFFDFFVFAIACVLVFPKLVFPQLSPLDGMLGTFAIFSLAFIARPIGTLIFMAIERAYGRGVKLTIALFMLGTSTVVTAFVPGHADIGVASAWILALFRIGQGLAWGGTWDGLPSLLAMYAPEDRRGWYAMLPQIGAPLGLALASGLFIYFLTHLSAVDFSEWGWRYPFFVAFAINVVALFARLRLVLAQEYVVLFEDRALQPAPVLETLFRQRRTIVLGAFAPLASFALFHMVTVFPLSWVFLHTDQSPARFLMIEMVGAFICISAIIASGVAADRFGRRRLLAVVAGGIAVFSGFAPLLLNAGQMGEMMYMCMGFILLGLSFGQASGVVSSNFPPQYRYTGSALTSDLAWLIGSAFAPFIALWLSSHAGLIMAGAYLLSGAICTVVALFVNRSLAARDIY